MDFSLDTALIIAVIALGFGSLIMNVCLLRQFQVRTNREQQTNKQMFSMMENVETKFESQIRSIGMSFSC